MTHSSNNAHGWRMLLLIPIAVMAILSIIATGGSSGDGEEFEPPEIPPTILTQYNFEIGSLINNMPLEFEVAALGSIAVSFGNTISGTVDLDVSATNEVTLLRSVTNVGSTLSITGSSVVQPALNGTFTINVTQPIDADIYDEPTSGVFEIVAGMDTITVTITATGVELSLNGAPAIPFFWSDYTDLLDGPGVPDWQRVASLAGGILEFVYEYFADAADALDDLEFIALNSPYTETCDMFSPPAGTDILAQGEGTITWQGTGELRSDDTFHWQFTDCWIDFGGEGELIDGLIQMSNYTETIDASNTLTRIGFEPSGGVNGGVEFLGYTISETEEIGGEQTIDPTTVISVSGGFSVIFEAP